MVRSRLEKGEKLFDLIFMDMHMPIMDGLEASEKIMELKTGVPLVAMTANIMTEDREMYELTGMNDCLGKPFTSHELWRCLLKYLKPINEQKEKFVNEEHSDEELQRILINIFVKSNQNKFSEITEAINTGDIKLAHRLVHTLKGNAGQLKKPLLQKAAEEVENCLTDEKNIATPNQLETLRAELNAVMKEFMSLVKQRPKPVITTPLDKTEIRELLEKLQYILENDNPECLEYIDKLHAIPGSEELVDQIETFDFKIASKTVAEFRKNFL
jgi:CheY-like chemotaxis protein